MVQLRGMEIQSVITVRWDLSSSRYTWPKIVNRGCVARYLRDESAFDARSCVQSERLYTLREKDNSQAFFFMYKSDFVGYFRDWTVESNTTHTSTSYSFRNIKREFYWSWQFNYVNATLEELALAQFNCRLQRDPSALLMNIVDLSFKDRGVAL